MKMQFFPKQEEQEKLITENGYMTGPCWGLGGKKHFARQSCQKYFCTTLIFQKDTIAYIRRYMYVIYNVHRAMSLAPILTLLLYTDLYVVVFKLFLFWVGKILPPPPAPMAMYEYF